jgi:hypothetical protein
LSQRLNGCLGNNDDVLICDSPIIIETDGATPNAVCAYPEATSSPKILIMILCKPKGQ